MNASISPSEFWKFLLLRKEAFESVRDSSGALWLSLRLFFVAGLIGSIGVLTTGWAEVQTTTLADRLTDAAASLDETASKPLLGWTPRLASALTAVADVLESGASAIRSVQPPLGVPASQALRAVGAWLSQPLLALTAWMTALLPLMLVARLMGGRGSLRQQMSLGLLAFLPQALVLLSSFGLEPNSTAAKAAIVASLLAGVWSLLIWLTASAVANRTSPGRSAAVLLVTCAVVFVLAAATAWIFESLAGPVLSFLL